MFSAIAYFVRCTLCVAFIPCIISAGILSQTNRYVLRSEYTDSIIARIENERIPFFSLPSTIDPKEHAAPVRIVIDNQTLNVNLETVAAVEGSADGTGLFGVLRGAGSYRSELLDAYVELNGYSMDQGPSYGQLDAQLERFSSGKLAPVSGMFSVDFTLPEAWLALKVKNLELHTGREKLRWGPGYKGTLALSGVSLSPFYYYRMIVSMGDRVKLQSYLAGFDDDRYFVKELSVLDTARLIKGITTAIRTSQPRFGAAQRLDIKVNDHVQFGLHEMVNFYGINDLTRYANPLQVYYLGYNSGTNEANMLAGCDLNIIVGKYRLYGEFINDDITIFDNKGNPNKYGFQTGFVRYGAVNSKVREIGIEYTHVSKYLYTHYSVLNRHQYWGESRGWPWGNKHDLLHARVQIKPLENLFLTCETNFWLWGNGSLRDDWYDDGRPDFDVVPFFPENKEIIKAVILSAQWRPLSWCSLDCTVSPRFRDRTNESFIALYATFSLPGYARDNDR